MTLRVLAAAFTLVTLVPPHGAAGQSLADLARREAERRKQTVPGKVYTNADLRDAPSAPPAVPSAAPVPRAAAGAEAARPEGQVALPDESVAPRGREKRDETYWRTRARDLRAKVEAARQQLEALEERATDLDTQIQESPAPSAIRERDVTASAVARMRQNLQFTTGELQRFEQKAAAEKVLPEWIQ